MSTSGKRLNGARLMQRNEELFRCPVCGESMKVDDGKSLLCTVNHRFDLAKQGYVNLMSHPAKTKYDRAMFDARRAMNEALMFEPLLARMSEMILARQQAINAGPDKLREVGVGADNQCQAAGTTQETLHLLDAGCGEGSHLIALCNKLRCMAKGDVLGVGIDIAKEGVQLAARDDNENIWIVGDLANSPLADKSFDVILNILSPSNYAEFHRLLNEDGLLVKIIPESGYLQELRTALYSGQDRESYSNEATVELFERSFDMRERERITYSVRLTSAQAEQLVYMTPLSWGAGEDQVRQVLTDHPLSEITCDFSILIGRKPSQ